MAVTTLDPKTALIVVDLQKGVVGLPTAHPVAEVVQNASALAASFRQHGLPVVLVNVAGAATGRVNQARSQSSLPADYAEIVAELNQQAQDHVVTKRTWGAFTNTDLHAYLQQRGVTQVVFAGVATSIGVESTARFAHEYGYNVTLALDAMTDMNAEAHQHTVTRIFPRIGECGSTQEIIALLDHARA